MSQPIPSIPSRFHVRANTPLGLLVFLAGVILIGFTFKLAFDMFNIPPAVQVGSSPEAPLKVESVIQSISAIFVKIILLVVMALFGSLVATRGIKLYSHRPAKPASQNSTPSES